MIFFASDGQPKEQSAHNLCRAGLVILSVVLHSDEQRTVEICLSDSYAVPGPSHLSEVRRIVIESGMRAQDDLGGLSMRPVRFSHAYEERGRHPLRTQPWSLEPRPHLYLANHDRISGDEGCKDTLFGFGTMLEAATLVGALLDIARPEEDGHEYDFEGPRAYGGVAAGSAELKVWFPGSTGWDLYPPTIAEIGPA